MVIFAPSSANLSAIARPMFEAAPVTITERAFKSKSIIKSLIISWLKNKPSIYFAYFRKLGLRFSASALTPSRDSSES